MIFCTQCADNAPGSDDANDANGANASEHDQTASFEFDKITGTAFIASIAKGSQTAGDPPANNQHKNNKLSPISAKALNRITVSMMANPTLEMCTPPAENKIYHHEYFTGVVVWQEM
jgi:hypothetical protein